MVDRRPLLVECGREEPGLSDSLSDREIRERRQLKVAGNDPDAFAPIFDAYVDDMFRYCRLRLRSRELAEDAASQVFVKAISSIGSYRGGSVSAWLFAIARTTVADIHVATSDVEGMFARVRRAGLEPLDHQQPGTALSGPVTRPWGDREFELEDPDGNRIIITQS